jgi:hypothetical protein
LRASGSISPGLTRLPLRLEKEERYILYIDLRRRIARIVFSLYIEVEE